MRLLPFLTLAFVAVSSAATAEPAVHFGISLAGFRVGWLTLSGKDDGARYAAYGHFETAGLAGLLNYTFDGKASGTRNGKGTELPESFIATSRSPRAVRETSIAWTNGIPTLISVIPPRVENVDPASEGGALDPVTVLVRLFRQRSAADVCGTEFRIFDGSRSVRLTLGDPVTSDGVITCEGDYLREAGEPFTPIDPPACAFQAIYRRAADGTVTLEEIRIPTRFGQAVLTRSA